MRSRPFRLQQVVLSVLAWIGLLALVAWSMTPIVFVVAGSFKSPAELFAAVPSLWPANPGFDNYGRLLESWPDFPRTLLNSLIVTLSTVAICLCVGSMAAYALSRARGAGARGLRAVSFGYIAVRMLPPIVITIPLFPLLRQTPFFDTLAALAVIYSALFVSLGIFVLKPFFDEVPTEIEEAALIDGCSRLGAFFRVLLPLARGGVVATGVFIGLDAWNEFVFALTFTSTEARTAPLQIGEMLGAIYEVDWGTVFAAATLQVVPVLAMVWLAQKHLIRGMTMGAVKG
jgi:multiple sugar transport system permease protein